MSKLKLVCKFGCRIFVDVWNDSDIMCDKKIKLINRTSKGLKCYDFHFNGIVPTSHPNLATFTHALHEEANRVVQWMEDIHEGQINAPGYDDPVFPNIPDGY